MKIKSLQLKNFKRFTDLTLQDIPENAKLVLLIGSNGSGKSCVFDAFEVINKRYKLDVIKKEQNAAYYRKNKDVTFSIKFISDSFTTEQFVTESQSDLGDSANTFYGRSAVRYMARLEKTFIGTPIKVVDDTDRPQFYIDIDKRFETDIDLLLTAILKKVINERNIEDVQKFIEKLNQSLSKIFYSGNYSQLELVNFETPSDGNPAQLLFKKGDAEIKYDLLSAGEKEIINLLINLYNRVDYFTNTIYFFDEIDAHLNTSLQYNLLKEIVENWIPDNCQFWTASHSLGFIQYANDYKNGCIIDFDDFDFDKKQVLTPRPKDDFEIFEIAVSKTFIDQVVQGRKIIFSENSDTPFYNDLSIPNTFFFLSIDKMDVFHKAKNHNRHGLIDRDYLSDDEVIQIKEDYPNLYILPYYSFENLLYHPDNLEEFYKIANKAFDKQSYIQQLVKSKNDNKDTILLGMLQARGGYPFYKENENIKKLKSFRENKSGLVDLIKSDEVEKFYKIFPAKDYGKEIPERQNIAISSLAQTIWFKNQIQKIIT